MIKNKWILRSISILCTLSLFFCCCFSRVKPFRSYAFLDEWSSEIKDSVKDSIDFLYSKINQGSSSEYPVCYMILESNSFKWGFCCPVANLVLGSDRATLNFALTSNSFYYQSGVNADLSTGERNTINSNRSSVVIYNDRLVWNSYTFYFNASTGYRVKYLLLPDYDVNKNKYGTEIQTWLLQKKSSVSGIDINDTGLNFLSSALAIKDSFNTPPDPDEDINALSDILDVVKDIDKRLKSLPATLLAGIGALFLIDDLSKTKWSETSTLLLSTFAFVFQLIELGDILITFDYDEEKLPEFPPIEYGDHELQIVDWSLVEDYIPYFKNLVGGIALYLYIRRLRKKLPDIIAGD